MEQEEIEENKDVEENNSSDLLGGFSDLSFNIDSVIDTSLLDFESVF